MTTLAVLSRALWIGPSVVLVVIALTANAVRGRRRR
jgi:hypothetical protein